MVVFALISGPSDTDIFEFVDRERYIELFSTCSLSA